ncbi:VaFE repeat-containing surface-anchored protein [Candidatus Saccharibacteria bacterium]|nr:VaFE repeat-containing surface-anchored protein [Candidatus Saccharibacteria bacterium]
MSFNLARKVHIRKSLVIALCTVICATLAFAAAKYIKDKVNAATPEGATVALEYNTVIEYFGTQTHNFKIGSHDAFCANASIQAPHKSSEGYTYTADNLETTSQNLKAIKLIAYIYTTMNTDSDSSAYMNAWLQGLDVGQRYGIVHSTISRLYSNDTAALDGNGLTRVNLIINGNSTVAGLYTLINNNTALWQRADKYKLYRINGDGIGSAYQNIVWIEPGSGKIKIIKRDAETNSSTPQGDATFAGIKFIVKKGNTEVYSCTLTGSNSSCTTGDLEVGTYTVIEDKTNTSYPTKVTSDPISKEVTSGNTVEVVFENRVKKGKLTVNKIDADTGTCTNTEGLNFVGVKIQLINKSNNPIRYNGSNIAKDAVVKTETMTANQCSITFNDLPYGSYAIKETTTSEGYVLNTNTINVSIPTDNSYDVAKTVSNQPIRGDLKFIKKNNVTNEPMANTVFSISRIDDSFNVKETHIVVTNEEGVVNTATSFIPHSQHTNGYDPIYDSVNQVTFSEFGTWFGLDNKGNTIRVKDSVGALPYGTYLIQELKCDANLFCTGIMDQKKTVKIETANQLVDLGNWDNDCTDFSLKTTAVDQKDGDHYVEASSESVIKDTIEYCVKPNMDFVIKGVLMDKTTGEKLLINGEPVESSVNLNSTEECGTTEMLFKLDTSALGGREIVVFESLYYKDSLVESHESIEDESQTVTIVSLATVAEDDTDGDKSVLAGEAAAIKDTIEYCVKAGQKYIIKGILMNKETREPVLVNGKAVEGQIELDAEESCGTTEMMFHFDATGLEGTDIVVFESLYKYNEDEEKGEEELIVAHEDINDESQTINIYIPAPETGLFTAGKSSNKTNDFIFIPAIIVVSVGGYSIYRAISRRKFFGKR